MIVEQVECRSYTGARRHELVAGSLGMRPKTTEQLGVGIALFVILYLSTTLWGLGSGLFQIIVLAGGPALAMTGLPRAQRDGRSALRIVAGCALSFGAARNGTIDGRPLRAARAHRSLFRVTVGADV